MSRFATGVASSTARPALRRARGGSAAAGLVIIALVAAGCGSEAETGSIGATAAPSEAEFPPTGGQNLVRFADDVGLTNDIVVSPAGSTYEPGKNRFSFGVFEADRTQIADAEVAIYAAHGPTGKTEGPFPARIESLATDPAFASRTSASDPDTATVAYVSDLSFDQAGEWRLAAVVKQGEGVAASLLPSIEVGVYPRIPDVGERPPRIHTPTIDDVGDISEIDTRVPPDTMHGDDLYDVLGQKPVVLLFATPALCLSRVCGPMVDVCRTGAFRDFG